ncbi:MAG TPA: YfhO family protein, partial [Candidatus Hydrogenedentes bacterium]|nr:YfhO family protein [Candidatus Hydrogenedentota bacterium]
MPEKAYAGMERVDFLNGLELLRNPKVLPWARLVFEVEEMPDPESQYLRMKDPGFNPGQVALVERLPEGWGGRNGPESSGTGSARVLRYTMNTVLVEAECTAPAILVTADAWFPGWKAWIDGRPTDTFPAYALFRSVALAPGKHLVEFRYRPASFLAGVSVTLITALVLVAVGCWV